MKTDTEKRAMHAGFAEKKRQAVAFDPNSPFLRGPGFFLEITLSKASELPNFGCFIKDCNQPQRRTDDPELVRQAIKCMKQGLALLRSKVDR